MPEEGQDALLQQVEAALEELYQNALNLVERLIDLDPPPDSPEGHLLRDLAEVVEIYEKEKYPFPAGKEEDDLQGE